METNRPSIEHLSTRQETLNRIYSKFLQLPILDVDVELIDPNKPDTIDNRRVVANKFIYYFQEGATTQGHVDQLSGTYTIETGELAIFYAKGIFATRIALKKNPETQNVDLVKSAVFTKVSRSKEGGFSMIPAVTESGQPIRPYLHAAESLLDDLEKEMIRNPKLFRKGQGEGLFSQVQLEQKQHLAVCLGAVLRNDLKRKKTEEEAEARRKKRRRGRRRTLQNPQS
jgi:hypothetical protein